MYTTSGQSLTSAVASRIAFHPIYGLGGVKVPGLVCAHGDADGTFRVPNGTSATFPDDPLMRPYTLKALAYGRIRAGLQNLVENAQRSQRGLAAVAPDPLVDLRYLFNGGLISCGSDGTSEVTETVFLAGARAPNISLWRLSWWEPASEQTIAQRESSLERLLRAAPVGGASHVFVLACTATANSQTYVSPRFQNDKTRAMLLTTLLAGAAVGVAIELGVVHHAAAQFALACVAAVLGAALGGLLCDRIERHVARAIIAKNPDGWNRVEVHADGSRCTVRAAALPGANFQDPLERGLSVRQGA